MKGWEDFKSLLLDFMNGKYQEPPVAQKHRGRWSFAEIVKGSSRQTGVSRGLDSLKSQEVRALDWKKTVVGTRRDFHDDWGRVLEMIKRQTEDSYIINVFQPDKALLKCSSKEKARLLVSNKGWVTFGPLTLKMELWNPILHGHTTVVPSYGGWITFRNNPLHLWILATFKAVGNCYGGFLDYVDVNSALIECTEVAIKVTGNYCGFIPAEVKLVDMDHMYIVHVSTYWESSPLIGKKVSVHGSFPLEATDLFYRGKDGSDTNPVEIWHVWDGFFYPSVKYQLPCPSPR